MDLYAKRLSAVSRALEQPATVHDSLVLGHAPLLSKVFGQVSPLREGSFNVQPSSPVLQYRSHNTLYYPSLSSPAISML